MPKGTKTKIIFFARSNEGNKIEKIQQNIGCMNAVKAISLYTSDFNTSEEKYLLIIDTSTVAYTCPNDAVVFAKKHIGCTAIIKIIKHQGVPSQPWEPGSCLWHSHGLCSLRPRSPRQAIRLYRLFAEAFATSNVKCQIMDVHRLSVCLS